ncbi:MAG: hypothetical protein WA851_17375 [Xanthobacteraceae bacterium]
MPQNPQMSGLLLARDRKRNRTARFVAVRGFAIPRARFGGGSPFSTRNAFRPEAEIFVRDFRDGGPRSPPQSIALYNLYVFYVFLQLYPSANA